MYENYITESNTYIPLLKCTKPKFIEIRDKEGIKTTRLVPCRKCVMCKKAIAGQWAQRLLYEASTHKGNNCFVTLTYNNENCPEKLIEEHSRNFIKKLRKHIKTIKIKYFYCGEYGETSERPHFHFIIFGYLPKKLYIHHYDEGKPIWSSPEIDKLWKFGFNQVGSVRKNSIYYVTGYILKSNGDRGFRRMSEGLGLRYALENKETLINNYQKQKINLPRYLVEKLEINQKIILKNEDEKLKKFYEKYGLKGIKDYQKKINNAKEYREKLVEAKEERKTRSKL